MLPADDAATRKTWLSHAWRHEETGPHRRGRHPATGRSDCLLGPAVRHRAASGRHTRQAAGLVGAGSMAGLPKTMVRLIRTLLGYRGRAFKRNAAGLEFLRRGGHHAAL